jgi:uncharacterized protein (DUF1330 family)
MPVYVIAQLRFKNVELYRRYQARFPDVLKKFPGGRLLVADEAPKPLEGSWDTQKIVIMSFASEDEARRFLDSPEYAQIAVDRRAGADVQSLLVRGIGRSE